MDNYVYTNLLLFTNAKSVDGIEKNGDWLTIKQANIEGVQRSIEVTKQNTEEKKTGRMAISFFSKLTIVTSTPAFAYDMAGAILGAILYEVSELSDQVLLIETDFLGNGEAIKGHFFVLPEFELKN